TERYDRFVVFDPATNSLLRVNQGIDQIYQTSNKNFQPRLGFVWDIGNDGKTVLRAGYSILTDQPVTNTVTGAAGNPPLAVPLSFNGAVTFQNALIVARAAGLAPSTINSEFLPAYVQSYNLNIQREISPTLAVQIGYFGSKGSDLRISRNLNQLVNGVRPFPTLSASSPILPGTPMGNISEVDSGANSLYNALWITVTKRLSHGLQFNGSYTLSKSID